VTTITTIATDNSTNTGIFQRKFFRGKHNTYTKLFENLEQNGKTFDKVEFMIIMSLCHYEIKGFKTGELNFNNSTPLL